MAITLRLNVDMKSRDTTFAIGEMAQRFGLATHVLRHWEAMGLLSPARAGGQRRYTMDDHYRVAAILRGKKAGLSLDQIQTMITSAPAPRREVLRAQREELQRRMEEMRAAMGVIDSVLRCRHSDFTQCPNYRAVINSQMGSDSPANWHQ
jgi:DNA-binding transcriptional MerR regulator